MTVATSDPAVRVRDVHKDFGDGSVLQGVDLDAPEGEITLLMGPNGVGKTILLSCVAGGLHPSQGDIDVLGRSPEDAGTRLSFMLQDGLLVDELSGRENVSFFQDLHPRSTDRWRTVLEELDFDEAALSREVKDYSGGMKRKLELAITLSVDVPLYLLDEPTAALDLTTVESLHSLLVDRKEAGKTILTSSHLPTDAQLADRVVFFGDDGVVDGGSPESLLSNVPRVVHVEGLRAGVDEYLLDGRLFEAGAERRGFLRSDVDPETVEALADEPGASVRVTDPATTDLFNYYVHVAPACSDDKRFP